MRKENDFFMVDNWTDRDSDAPVVVLMDAGFDRRAASAILVHLLWSLFQISADGIRPAKEFRRWLSELDFSDEEIFVILGTNLFEQIGEDKLFFTPFRRQAKGIADYNAKAEMRHERAVKASRAAALVPNNGRFQKGNKAACKHKEEAVAVVAEEVKKEAEPAQEEVEFQAEEERKTFEEEGMRLAAVMAIEADRKSEEARKETLEVPKVKGEASQWERELEKKELAKRSGENSRIAEWNRKRLEIVQAIS